LPRVAGAHSCSSPRSAPASILRDVAANAVAVLANRESENQTLVIGGSQPLSWRDIVATFAKELGRDVPVRTLPLGTPVPDTPAVVSELLTGAAPTPGQC
jgi:NADH dehydrogenase